MGRLQDEYLKTLQQAGFQLRADYRAGLTNFVRVVEANQALGEANVDREENRAVRIRTLERMLETSLQTERLLEERLAAGVSPRVDVLEAKAARLEVEIRLQREKKASKNPPPAQVDNVRKLQEEYVRTMQDVVRLRGTLYSVGLRSFENVRRARMALVNAEIDLCLRCHGRD